MDGKNIEELRRSAKNAEVILKITRIALILWIVYCIIGGMSEDSSSLIAGIKIVGGFIVCGVIVGFMRKKTEAYKKSFVECELSAISGELGFTEAKYEASAALPEENLRLCGLIPYYEKYRCEGLHTSVYNNVSILAGDFEVTKDEVVSGDDGFQRVTIAKGTMYVFTLPYARENVMLGNKAFEHEEKLLTICGKFVVKEDDGKGTAEKLAGVLGEMTGTAEASIRGDKLYVVKYNGELFFDSEKMKESTEKKADKIRRDLTEEAQIAKAAVEM